MFGQNIISFEKAISRYFFIYFFIFTLLFIYFLSNQMELEKITNLPLEDFLTQATSIYIIIFVIIIVIFIIIT